VSRWGPWQPLRGPRGRDSWETMAEDLPVDVLPCSNDEFFPPPPSREQLTIMALQDAEVERWRRKFNMSRREFVRTSAAMAIGFWAIDTVRPGIFGTYGGAQAVSTGRPDACDLEWAGRKGLETVKNLPGEFIFDVQSHHVDPDGMWRVTNPGIHAFFNAVWPQTREGGEADPIENLSRYHYLKELFLDSATTCTVLSVVPTSPDADNPLPVAEASQTIDVVNELARSKRTVMHAFVMPNRGSTGDTNPTPREPDKPLYLDEELNLMMERADQYHDRLRGWKTYCAWGSVPNASGWTLDSDVGMAFLEQVKAVSKKYPEIPPTVATHKGFALPGFDQRGAAPRDVGPAAKANPDVNIVVYHSGYDIGDEQKAYRGDEKADSRSNTVDGLIKSLRENNYDASHFRKKGHKFGNVPNVYAELGSVWRDVMSEPDQAAHLLGKLINHVGPKRVVWGTDSLWYGSPQPEIVALRRFDFTAKGREMYGLPYGLEGDVEDPTRKAPTPARTIRNGILGRNVAGAYRVDPDKKRHEITCDQVNALRDDEYTLTRADNHLMETRPYASNVSPGARTRREVWKSITEGPWSP
jgi:predicted TIM-barrel fold metal-dependent hydrolase